MRSELAKMFGEIVRQMTIPPSIEDPTPDETASNPWRELAAEIRSEDGDQDAVGVTQFEKKLAQRREERRRRREELTRVRVHVPHEKCDDVVVVENPPVTVEPVNVEPVAEIADDEKNSSTRYRDCLRGDAAKVRDALVLAEILAKPLALR